jgi:hypothetical protein
VIEAGLWGLFAASSLLLGAFIAEVRPPGARVLGVVMGFGSGVLLSAVSFELIEEAVDPRGDCGHGRFAQWRMGTVVGVRLVGRHRPGGRCGRCRRIRVAGRRVA